ncbi:Forkhead box protein I1 [Hypsizygus marmoreus]|uniref:Forkhead box protein I1 n=1 Tax=Hypsizygus marmoreus TaxID=39966 RepID=A0A369JZW0_HYPMA|nr:Forkhead box protein I1 [Hypsizygus marmoreus]
MSRSYYQGFLPSLHFSSPSPINSFTIPRSYNHSSDESETGGGGGSPASHGDSQHIAQDHTVTDAPFIPRRDNPPTNSQPSRDLILPPDTRNYIYGAPQASSPPTTYSDRPSPYDPQSRHGPIYASDPARHLSYLRDDQRPQWPNVSPDPSDYLYHPEVADPYSVDQEILPSAPDMTRQTQSRFPRHGRTYPEVSASSRFTGYSRRLVASRQDPPSPSPEYSANIKHSPSSTPISLSPSLLQTSDTFIEEWLRSVTNIPEGMPVNLWSLPGLPPNQRPALAQRYLAALAIWGSEKKRLTLKAIYAAISARFPAFNDPNDKSWQGSIRHSLSLHNIFKHIGREITEPGKGGYWELDISKGDGYKRPRKRRSKQDRDIVAGDYEMSEESEDSSPGPSGTPQEPSSGASRSRTPKLSAPYPVRPSAGQPTISSGLRQMSVSPTPPSSQAAFGQSSYHSSTRHPAFGQTSMGPGSLNRAQSQPNFTTLSEVSRPHSRSATVPAPGTYAPMAPLRLLLGMPVVHFQLPNRQGGESEGSSSDIPMAHEDDEDQEQSLHTLRDPKGKGRAR